MPTKDFPIDCNVESQLVISIMYVLLEWLKNPFRGPLVAHLVERIVQQPRFDSISGHSPLFLLIYCLFQMKAIKAN